MLYFQRFFRFDMDENGNLTHEKYPKIGVFGNRFVLALRFIEKCG